MTKGGRPALPPAYHYGRLIALAEAAEGKPDGWLIGNCLNFPGELTKHFPQIVQVSTLNTRATRIAAHLRDWPTRLSPADQRDALSGYHAERAALIRGRWVAKTRRDSGLPRPAFAERIGVSPRTVEGWEQHQQDVPHDAPDRIRAALSLSED